MTQRNKADSEFVVEESPAGRTLVVTGTWTGRAERVLTKEGVSGLELNYARGFCEGDLEFLQKWPVQRLLVLDRKLIDLSPIERFAETLEELQLEASPSRVLKKRRFGPV